RCTGALKSRRTSLGPVVSDAPSDGSLPTSTLCADAGLTSRTVANTASAIARRQTARLIPTLADPPLARAGGNRCASYEPALRARSRVREPRVVDRHRRASGRQCPCSL